MNNNTTQLRNAQGLSKNIVFFHQSQKRHVTFNARVRLKGSYLVGKNKWSRASIIHAHKVPHNKRKNYYLYN